jgi:hypothetical protein
MVLRDNGMDKNRLTEKYQDMRANGKMMATDDKIKSRAVEKGKIYLKRTSKGRYK